MDWIDKIFVINLNRSTDRWKNCMEQSEKYKFRLERFTAIEGNKLTPEQQEYIHPLCKYLFCTRGMMGCALSHYFLLKQIVDQNIQTAIILEDDFVWKDDTISKLDKIKDFNKGIVKLSCIGPFCSSNSETSDTPQIAPFSLGNASYLIRNNQAKELLDKIQNVIHHIDLQYAIIGLVYSLPFYYYPCIDIGGMEDSTLGAHKTTLICNLIPLSERMKWFLNEPFIAPFNRGIHLFLFFSILLIFIGFYIYPTRQWLGLALIIIGVIDIVYYNY